MAEAAIERQQTGTRPEDLFVGLFAEVFGLEKVQLLAPQHPVADIEGNTRYIDFALRTVAERIAFEIDGLTWHVPDPDRVRDDAVPEAPPAAGGAAADVCRGWRRPRRRTGSGTRARRSSAASSSGCSAPRRSRRRPGCAVGRPPSRIS